jgi:sulfate transport system permease protein
MAGSVTSRLTRTTRSQRGTEELPWVRRTLIGIAVAFASLFLVLPLANVFVQAFSKGIAHYFGALADPDTQSAVLLTLTIALIAVPLNVFFGVVAAWLISKFDFTGKALLLTLIDLPFSVSPVVSGLIYIVLFGLQGYFGEWLLDHNLKIIFAVPGITLATMFVTFPFVARELIPIMQAQGSDQEEAALTLGASGWQTFFKVTLPSVKWGLIYGVILCNARAMGEFGAVSVVSGHITGQTDTLPLRVDKLYHEYNQAAAFSVASVLALLALVTLGIKTWLEHRQAADFARAQSDPSAE